MNDDLKYREKYLKYKAKYINLKNQIDEQDGGVSFLTEAIKKTKKTVKKVTDTTGKIIDAVSSYWIGGYYIIFFDDKDLKKSNDSTTVQEIIDLLNNKNNWQNKKLKTKFNIEDFRKSLGSELWYIKQGDTNIRRNILQTESKAKSKFENVCGIEEYNNYHFLLTTKNIVDLSKEKSLENDLNN